MKFRLTILTENDIPRKPGLTEETVAKAWQFILDFVTAGSGCGSSWTRMRSRINTSFGR